MSCSGPGHQHVSWDQHLDHWNARRPCASACACLAACLCGPGRCMRALACCAWLPAPADHARPGPRWPCGVGVTSIVRFCRWYMFCKPCEVKYSMQLGHPSPVKKLQRRLQTCSRGACPGPGCTSSWWLGTGPAAHPPGGLGAGPAGLPGRPLPLGAKLQLPRDTGDGAGAPGVSAQGDSTSRGWRCPTYLTRLGSAW